LIVPGLILQNSLVTAGFAAVTNQISVCGYANRIAA
jgi:hypothetical protein